MKKVASLRYGVIFKKAFSQPDVFTAFVKAVLGIDLEIDTVETEKSSITPKERADMIEEYSRAELARKEALESWQEGKELGRLEATYVIAKNLLSKGVDVETVTETTGLTSDEIQKLF